MAGGRRGTPSTLLSVCHGLWQRSKAPKARHRQREGILPTAKITLALPPGSPPHATGSRSRVQDGAALCLPRSFLHGLLPEPPVLPMEGQDLPPSLPLSRTHRPLPGQVWWAAWSQSSSVRSTTEASKQRARSGSWRRKARFFRVFLTYRINICLIFTSSDQIFAIGLNISALLE